MPFQIRVHIVGIDRVVAGLEQGGESQSRLLALVEKAARGIGSPSSVVAGGRGAAVT
jgi:hypothetical protein